MKTNNNNNNIQTFNNNKFGDLRTLLVNNIPYFIGKDVTDRLEYQNGSRDIIRHVDEEDRISVTIHDGKQNRNMIAINESGLYSLILSSKLPKAKEFKKWVTSKVLPTIHSKITQQNTQIKVIDNRDVFGKPFKIYGSYDSPLFLAKDIAYMLGLTNVSDMIKRVSEDEVTKLNLGGLQGECNFLTEYGLYEVLMQSRKPIAKQFKKKVKEILKDIRRYGMYVTDEVLYSPELLEKALEQIIKERKEKLKLQFEVKSLKDTNKQLKKNTKQLSEAIQEQEPLVELSKTLLKAKNSITFGNMAKMLKTNGVNIGRNRLTRFLREQGVLTQDLTPYQNYMDKGYFYVYQTIIGGKTVVGTRINPQGQLFIVTLIMKEYNK